jgi:hypothetical protein
LVSSWRSADSNAPIDVEPGQLPRVLRVLDLALEDARCGEPVAIVDVHGAHRRERRQVRRIEVDGPLVVLDGGEPIAELFLEQPSSAVVQLHALGRLTHELGEALEHLDRRGLVVGLLVEPRQRVQRLDVILVELRDVQVGVDGTVVVLELVGVDVA